MNKHSFIGRGLFGNRPSEPARKTVVQVHCEEAFGDACDVGLAQRAREFAQRQTPPLCIDGPVAIDSPIRF